MVMLNIQAFEAGQDYGKTSFKFDRSNYSTQHFITTNGLFRDPGFTQGGYSPTPNDQDPSSVGDPFRQNIGEHWAMLPNVTDYLGIFKDYDSNGGLPPMGGGGIAALLNNKGVTVYPSAQTLLFDDGSKKVDRMLLHFEPPQREEQVGLGDSIYNLASFFTTMASVLAPPQIKVQSEYSFTFTSPGGGVLGAGGSTSPATVKTSIDAFKKDDVTFNFHSFNVEEYEGEVNGFDLAHSLFKQFAGQIEDTDYRDISFKIDLPMTEKLSSAYNKEKTFLRASINPKYNFLVGRYESALEIADLPETILPNIYAFDDVLRSSTKKNSSLKSAVTLWNEIANVTDIFKSNKAAQENSDNVLPSLTNATTKLDIDFHYFDSYGKMIQALALDESAYGPDYKDAKYTESKRNMEHIVFTPKVLQKQNDLSELKNVFPMYTDISFDTEGKSEFGTLLDSLNLYLPFVKYTISKLFNTPVENGLTKGPDGNSIIISPGPKPIDEMNTMETANNAMVIKSHVSTRIEVPPTNAPHILQIGDNVKSEPRADIVESSTDILRLRSCRLQSFMDFYNSEAATSTNLVGPFGIYFGDSGETESIFSKQFNMLLFNAGYEKLKKSHFRNYGDICNGKKAYTETIFYRIEKSLNGTVLQNIWLPNVEGKKTLNYIDTQVKYGRGYDYNIYAYKIVFGSKYRYDLHVVRPQNPDSEERIAPTVGGDKFSYGTMLPPDEKIEPITGTFQNPEGGYIKALGYWAKKNSDGIEAEFATYMDALVEQDVFLIETPYYGDQSTIFDDPPMPPEVEILPYMGISNRILLSFSPDSGERDLPPITLNETESELIDQIRIAQDRTFKDQNNNFLEPYIRYKSDEFPYNYETYRTTTKPNSYEDFGPVYRNTLAVNSGFVDPVAPNTKYYYMFRTIDSHGKFSNPSPIYKFEMVDDGGSLYPQVSVLSPGDGFMKNKTHSQSMRKYIQISPALAQTLLNEEASGLAGSDTAVTDKDPVLGITSESIWNEKRFKVRLVSRSTGRKIDLNLNFTTDHLTMLKPKPIAAMQPIEPPPNIAVKVYFGLNAFDVVTANTAEEAEEQQGALEETASGGDGEIGTTAGPAGDPPPQPKSSIDY